MKTGLAKGQRIRLTNGEGVGVVKHRTPIGKDVCYLIEWANGNEPSYERRSDIVPLKQ